MSYSFLFGIPGKIKTLLSRLTETRANNLDNLPRLDVNVSSRADGAYYTAARAAKLDNLDAAVSSRLPANDARLVNLDAANQAKLILNPVTDCLGSDYPPLPILNNLLISPPPINTSLVYAAGSLSISPATTNEWQNTFAYSGAGYLLGLCVQVSNQDSDSHYFGFKVRVDGVTVFNSGAKTRAILSNTRIAYMVFPITVGFIVYGNGAIGCNNQQVLEIGSSLEIDTYKSDSISFYLSLLIKKKAY